VNKHKKDRQANVPEKTQYEQHVELKQRMKSMLENEQLIPRVSRILPPDAALRDRALPHEIFI